MWKQTFNFLTKHKKTGVPTLKTKHLAYNYLSSDTIKSFLVNDDLENADSTVR